MNWLAAGLAILARVSKVKQGGTLALVGLFVSATGCVDGAEEPAAEREDATAAVQAEPAEAHSTGSAHEHGPAAPGEGQTLLVIMRQLSVDMAAVSQGLWLEDWETMTDRSGALAAHAPIAAEEIERIHGILGGEMPAFEELDEAVHQASVRMHEAAEARDMDGFVDAFTESQRGCVSCHTRFRDRLRTVPQ